MRKKKNRISIIIPCYNAENEIEECLGAIFNSNFKNFEVICVDDKSSDNTAKKILKYSKVKLIKLKKNGGPSVSRNRGVREAKGNLFLFIDSDVIIKKDTLQLLINDINEKKVDVVVGIYSKKHPYRDIASNYKNLHLRYTYLIMPDYISITNGSLTLVKKSVFNKIGGYNEKIKIPCGEDWDLGSRIASRGYKVHLDKKIDILHNKNFTLTKILRTDFFKAFQQSKIVLRSVKRKKGLLEKKRIGTIPLYMIISAPLNFMIALLFLFTIITFNVRLFHYLLIFIALYLFINRKFFLYLYRIKGFLFFLASIGIYFLDIWSIIFGSFLAIIDYFILNNRY